MATYIVRKNHVISMVRGDHAKFSFEIPTELLELDDTDVIPKYVLPGGVVLYFALMFPNKPFEDSILIKEYSTIDEENDSLVVELSSADTELLTPGCYYYTIKLATNLGEGEVYTIIPNTKFFIVD